MAGPFINAENAGKAGANATEVRLCFLGTLDPAKVAGKIVLCDRGVNARIDKSLEVKNTGGIGMVMINTSANSVNADLHFVPIVHIDHTNYAAIKAYANSAGATAAISKGVVTNNLPAPFIAAFSSRGPLLAGDGDILKPDISAPGQDVLAAVAPPGNHGRLFDMLSGTSMASPHVAGLGAMLDAAASDVVAGGAEVRAHDDGVQLPGQPVRLGRRPRRRLQGRRSGPRLRRRVLRLARVPARPGPRRRHARGSTRAT